MNFSSYKSHKRFGIIAQAYDLQGDEEISIALILFGRGFKLLVEPKKRIIPHFEFRLPATAIIERGGKIEVHKTKVFECGKR